MCQMAEQLTRLDAVIDARFKTSHNNKNKQNTQCKPLQPRWFSPTDVQISLLNYLQVPRKCNMQYDRNYHGGRGGYRNNYKQYSRNNHKNTNSNNYNRRQYNQNYNQNNNQRNNQNNNPHYGLTCYLCGKSNHIACNCHSWQSNGPCGRPYDRIQGQLNIFTENDNAHVEQYPLAPKKGVARPGLSQNTVIGCEDLRAHRMHPML